ncbi:MAG: hypothetical protein FJ405_01640 [Verrucomicrobia bacterium]|nr:hypothetical protein [Verrucomicrobiota bacterium]
MNVPLRTIRRATLDDLPRLSELWTLERLPVQEFEPRFKEFQVAESDSGELLGALGVQAAGVEVRLHHEAFSSFEHADELRARFWERIQVMGQNQGWVRAWTDLSTQGWRNLGFDPATPEQLTRVPEAFGHPLHGVWHVIQLRSERAKPPSIDAELQLLRMQSQAETQKLRRRARFFQVLAAILVTSLVTWSAVNLYRYKQHRQQIQGR